LQQCLRQFVCHRRIENSRWYMSAMCGLKFLGPSYDINTYRCFQREQVRYRCNKYRIGESAGIIRVASSRRGSVNKQCQLLRNPCSTNTSTTTMSKFFKSGKSRNDSASVPKPEKPTNNDVLFFWVIHHSFKASPIKGSQDMTVGELQSAIADEIRAGMGLPRPNHTNMILWKVSHSILWAILC